MNIKNVTRVTVDLPGSPLTLETGALARQAGGAVACQIGETIVFSTACTTGKPREGLDFFPLQIEYREKTYAAGRFPGGYFKREGRPSEKEILTSRVTDRPIRPLFPDGFKNEVQIINTLLCADGENESDTISINAASAALTLSNIPFLGPIGAVRVGRIEGNFVLNPTHAQMAKSDLDLVYAGTRDKFLMMEGSAQEISEADFVAAMKFGHQYVIKIIDAQLELRRLMGLPEKPVEAAPVSPHLAKAHELVGEALTEALLIAGKKEREGRVTEIKARLKEKMTAVFGDEVVTPTLLSSVFDQMEIDIVRRNVLVHGKRIDGRGFTDLRPLEGQVSILPRTHGSALFQRGETQALAIATLGTSDDILASDGITAGGKQTKSFYLHYNFPPFSTGEVGRLGSTGRREIGHGALAERSLAPVMPKDYPYTVRLVSEVMGSNGSSSMASVCAGTLALMDAGIPIAKPVAGISIGLFTDENKEVLVTDILGAEDHCGDMDFKVAGTRDGITGFQVDLKIRGLAWPLVEGAFALAQQARIKILEKMAEALPQPRAELSPYAPRIELIHINPERIGALIGPGGKNIRRICDTTGAQIDIDDDGTVRVFANNGQAMEAAVREVNLVAADAEPGKIYQGTVTGVKDFGAFVEILPGKEGLVHVSELANYRVERVSDVVKMGDVIPVKCLSVDDNGKIRLSLKAARAELGEQNPA